LDIGAQCTCEVLDIIILAEGVVSFFVSSMDVVVMGSFEEHLVAICRNAESGVLVQRVDHVEENVASQQSALESLVFDFVGG
jgi:hypothetical protein